MNKINFSLIKKSNKVLRNIVRETSNFKMISRFYATKYNKIKVREQTYFYETRDGQNFSDSPLQILKSVLQRNKYAEHYIVYQNKYFDEVILGLNINKIDVGKMNNVHLVERNTPEYVEAQLFSKYLITDSTFQSFFVKKPEQIYVNTWHGTPLKYMGYAMPEGNFQSWNVMRNFMMSDYLVSPNKHTTEIFLNDYRLNGAYTGEILEIGYPRNDVFFNSNDQNLLRQYLIENHNLDKNKLTLVYAPTWRPAELASRPSDLSFEYANLYEVLCSELGGEYNILMKVHPFIYNRLKNIESVANFIVSDGIDANELLAMTDLLVTDFSSIFFDYLITNKPIVFFNTDPDVYEEERGYYFSLKSLPGPFFSEPNQMIDYIQRGDFTEYGKNYSDFKSRFVNLDDGNVTQTLLNLIENRNQKNEQIIKADTKKNKVLIYTGGLQNNGISAALINLVNHIDYGKYDVSLLTADSRNNNAFYNNFKKINNKVRIFVIRGESSYGWAKLIGKYFAEKYSNIKIFYFLYSRKQAKLNARRLLGNQAFDVAIDFDSYVMDNGQWIASSDAKHTYNVLHNDMWLEANKTIGGELKNPKTKAYLPFWGMFDTSLSVSEATKEINEHKLIKYIHDNGVLTNIIDAEKIIDLANQSMSYKNINISKFRKPVDMTNSSEITKATFGDVDMHKRNESIYKSGISNGARIFITNSRLSPEKNLDNLILAFIKLHNRFKDVQLQIFGKDVGNYAPVLYELVIQNHAEEYIKFYGYSDNTFPALLQADMFLLPSHTEGQSIALMEAMVLKKDIIASNVLANIELLNNGEYGLLTLGNDVDALYESLKIAVEGRYKRLKDFDASEHNNLVLRQFDNLFKEGVDDAKS
ncbi:CDP-glycerol glycerophosphotransferase family protein [Leuconostoc gasicomitatum]|uniref:CDP-glycerol glycerophosphotransferase family protein n=1 Tax=Leuconostoc gasicomitatum TaxID=115778 RepID=UPI001CC496B9|nr:CDP-glycerol glycerophosphotransferase family protein [Leuconostoc gasicomitatum]MBZ5955496.1 CDP-glycerol glycerophosphotransferase family protein [Leuconostoc gasicomitatum]MBZ5984311.1 CDP-glycerol glycerophosphotransferase family protein [Leuconostoc gasicomitatum]